MWSEVADMVHSSFPVRHLFGRDFPRHVGDFHGARFGRTGQRSCSSRAPALGYGRGQSLAVQTAHCGHVGVDRPSIRHGKLGAELVDIANGDLLLGKKGEYSAAVPAEQLRDADPEYLIVAPCGFNLERSLREQTVVERYPWWDGLQAVQNGKVAFADGNLFFYRSGMTVSQTAEIIAEILHGVSFGEKTEEFIGIGAKRMSRET